VAGAQRVYKARIKSTQALKKVFRAQELIAASRIGKARAATSAAQPYARALTHAVSAVATHGGRINHPLISGRKGVDRAAVLVVTADRGMAGAYSANVIREAEAHIRDLRTQGKEVDLYVSGRRGEGYYQYRAQTVARSWTGGSDAPQLDVADEIGRTLLEAFAAEAGQGGVSELYVVYTEFVNMVTQRPRIVRLLPLEIVEADATPAAAGSAHAGPDGSDVTVHPLYEFEPSAEGVLDALLPRYVRSRIYSMLLQAAASELASRQRAMHTATENAEELIRTYSRLANQARQGEITQEISEIVSGADALKAS